MIRESVYVMKALSQLMIRLNVQLFAKMMNLEIKLLESVNPVMRVVSIVMALVQITVLHAELAVI